MIAWKRLKENEDADARAQFTQFIANLKNVKLKIIASGLWQEIDSRMNTKFGEAAPCPTDAGSSEDNQIFSFVWDRDEFHLEFDIHSDNETEWFFLNRKTGKTDSENDETVIKNINRFIDYLVLI